MSSNLAIVPASNVPYFTPAQFPAAGTAVVPQPDGKEIPTLFQPLKIRGVELQNRIVVSPMAQYSAKNGLMTPWHHAQLGGIIIRGPGLSFTEAVAVTPQGRSAPEDLGIWSDEQAAAYKELTTFAHSQNQKIGIQLLHAGRKASTVTPWLSFNDITPKELGGWPDEVYGPSAIPHPGNFPQPKELTKQCIKDIVKAHVDAAKRSVEAGFDVIELHGAHGFLLHEFASPVSNQRTDEYGGSFENRVRIILEIVDGIRAVIPSDMPLFYRISATDRLETSMPDTPSWTITDSIKLAGILADHGVDLLDVSSAGNHSAQTFPPLQLGEAFHADLSAAIKAAVGDKILIATVGGIKTGQVAQNVLTKKQADVVFVGRHFLKNPGAVWQFAEELGVRISVANQIEWGFFGRGVGRTKAQ